MSVSLMLCVAYDVKEPSSKNSSGNMCLRLKETVTKKKQQPHGCTV